MKTSCSTNRLGCAVVLSRAVVPWLAWASLAAGAASHAAAAPGARAAATSGSQHAAPAITAGAAVPDGPQFSLRDHFNWKIAICYHPMYLIVNEDRGTPIVGERVPPWGAATVEDYLERVKRNLAALERDPKLKLNYEWAACDLDDLARRSPDVMRRMRDRCQKGQLAFVGGEYSQAHTVTMGSETAWRQVACGQEVFQRLLGRPVVVHATQECHLHPQLPQILQHFGFKYLVMPFFPWSVKITKGPFEFMGAAGYCLKQGDEFIRAVAPDGTALPAYFATEVGQTNPNQELMKDLWSSPPIWMDFPDLEEFHNPLGDWAEPVLLEPALDERFRAAPPRAQGEVRTYESYAEGVWAEAHLRQNKIAEETAVLAEQVAAMARGAGPAPERQRALDGLWRTILKYQNHDVTWIEVTDLRRKAIQQQAACVRAAQQLMGAAAAALVQPDAGAVAVFNGLPRARRALLDVPAGQIPGGGAPFQQLGDRCLGVRDLPAGGFRSFPREKRGAVAARPAALPQRLATDHYAVEFTPAGLIKQLTTAGRRDLLATGKYLGGEIRAVVADRWVDNRTARAVTFAAGDVCDVVERTTTLGRVPLRERYLFFRHAPGIKAELEFAFQGDEIGDFHIEETKVNIYYPTAGGPVYHDIPFGYEQGREGEQWFAPNWVYAGGLVYVNRGTPKHWVRDGVLANTVAWGGRRFSNRIHWDWTKRRQYDLRLDGPQTIEYYLIPAGPFDAAAVVQAVDALTAPVFITTGRGERSCYAVRDAGLAVTAVYEHAGRLWARGYQLPAQQQARFHDWEIFNTPVEDLQ